MTYTIDNDFNNILVENEQALRRARSPVTGPDAPIQLEAQIPPQEPTPDIPGGTRSNEEIDAILAKQDRPIGEAGLDEAGTMTLPEVEVVGTRPRFTVTDPRINAGRPTPFDTLSEAKTQAGTPEPLAQIEEDLGHSTFVESLKTAEQKDAAKNFVELLNIPVEHLAGFLAKGDATQTATPEELGQTILSPVSVKLQSVLDDRQMAIFATVVGLLGMVVIDPLNPALSIASAAKVAGKSGDVASAAKTGSREAADVPTTVSQAKALLKTSPFSDAIEILKSERGSIPVGGGKPPLNRERFQAEKSVPAGSPPSSLAERITRDMNDRTKVLTDVEGDRLAQAMIDSGEIDVESLKVLLPGTTFKSNAEALAAHEIVKREQGLFIDTATLAADTGDPALIDQAFSELYGLVNAGIPVSSASTITAQMLRRASSHDIKAANLILERAAKTTESQSKLDMLKSIIADPRTDPAAQGKTHTASFRAVISSAKKIVERGDEGEAEIWIQEVETAIESEAQFSMFVTKDDVTAAQLVQKNVTAQPIIKRKPFVLTSPTGGAPKPRKPTQLMLLDAIAAETQPEQLAVEMADTIEVGNREVSKEFLSLIKRGQEAIASGDPEKVGKILGRIQKAFEEKAIAASTELKRPTRLVGLEKKAFDAFFSDAANKGLSAKDLLRVFVDSMPREREFLGLLKELKTPSGWDVWQEQWYNGMLLGLAPIKNLVGTPVVLASEIAQRGVMAGLDAGGVGLIRLLTNADFKRSVYFGEVGAMLNMRANYEAFVCGARLAWHTFKSGKPEFDISTIEHVIPDVSNTALWLNATGPLGQGTAWLSTAAKRWQTKGIDLASTAGGRLLLSGDTLNKVVGHQAQYRALALREAYQTVEREGLEGVEAVQRAIEVKRDVMTHAERYPELRDDAERFAQYITFQQELGVAATAVGDLAQRATLGPRGAMGGLSGFPVGKWMHPFNPIMANMGKMAGEFSGPLQLLSPAIQEELRTDGPRRLAALSKIAFSTMALNALYVMAGDGLITGSGPRDKKANLQWQKATGKTPNAWWDPVSKQYRSCAAFEPFCTVASAAADLNDMMSYTPPDKMDALIQGFQALTIAVVNNAGVRGWTQGLVGTINTAQSGDFDSYSEWFGRAVAGTMVPYSGPLRQITAGLDPHMRRAVSTIDRMKNNIPGLSDSLPLERNGLGKPLWRKGGWWNAFPHGEPSEDQDVWQALNAHNYVLGLPHDTLRGLQLDGVAYDQYILAVTDGLDDKLRAVIDKDSAWTDQEFAAKVNEQVVRQREKGTRSFLRGRPDIAEAIKDLADQIRTGERRAPSKFIPGRLPKEPASSPSPELSTNP